jgi:hypothetical protein
MQKKPWKLIASIDGPDGKPGYKEYFIVRATCLPNAIVALCRARPDLTNIQIEASESREGFLDWFPPGADVFSVMVVS